jgi:hypothetical protein
MSELVGGSGEVMLTASSFRLSSLWRGMTVTISISHRNATSIGVMPGGSGSAMTEVYLGFHTDGYNSAQIQLHASRLTDAPR